MTIPKCLSCNESVIVNKNDTPSYYNFMCTKHYLSTYYNFINDLPSEINHYINNLFYIIIKNKDLIVRLNYMGLPHRSPILFKIAKPIHTSEQFNKFISKINSLLPFL